MKTTLLRALRAETQNWWAHKDLRACGKTRQALAREHQSMRSNVNLLRQALRTKDAYVSCGRGGTSIYAGNTTQSSHGSLTHHVTAQIAILLGLPFINTTTVEHPHRLIGLPLVATGHDPDPAPWHSMSYAPLTVYLARARALGACVINAPPALDAETGS